MKRTLTFIIAILIIASMAAFAADSTAPAKPTDGEKRVTLQLKDTPLPQVLEMLFKDRHMNYVLEPMTNALTVSMIMEDVSFQDALQAVIRAAGASVRKENGVYFIGPSPQNPVRQMPPSTPVEPASGVNSIGSEVFTLRYLRPAEITPMIMTIAGVKTVSSVGTSKLIVTATQYAIGEVRSLIEELDDPSAFPTPVRVNVEVRSAADGAGQPCRFSTDGRGAMGSTVPLMLQVAKTPGPGARPTDEPSPVLEIEAEVTPNLVSGGMVALRGEGTFGCVVADQQISKEFNIVATASLGKPVLIASLETSSNGVTRSFEVYATVTIDPTPPAQPKAPAKPAPAPKAK